MPHAVARRTVPLPAWVVLKISGMNAEKLLPKAGFIALAIHLGTLQAAQPGEKLWEFTTSGQIRSSAAIGTDGTVYIGSLDHHVYALDGTTGERRWDFPTLGPVVSSPAIGPDGTVYVGSLDYRLYALDGVTGAKRWEVLTGREVNSSPAIGEDGSVYVGSLDGKVYALDGATGQTRWAVPVGGEVRSSPALGTGGSVYVGVGWPGPWVVALSAATGAVRWQFIGRGLVHSSPALGADGTVYVGSDDAKVHALDGVTGQVRWEFQANHWVVSSPAIGPDGTVYVGCHNGSVYALDGATGQKRWEFVTRLEVHSSPAIAADGVVYVGGVDGHLYALDAATGQPRWTFDAGAAVTASPTLGADGTVYIGASNFKVYAIRGDQGPAPSSWPGFGGDAQHTRRPNHPPVCRAPASPVVLREGQEGRIQVAIAGKPTPEIQWLHHDTAVAGGSTAALVLAPATRALEGQYRVTARNSLGETTSAPIPVLVSNVEAERFLTIEWQGAENTTLTLESADHVGPEAKWQARVEFLPGAARQRFVESERPSARYYRLRGVDSVPVLDRACWLTGVWLEGPVGSRHVVEYAAASSGWTNWNSLTEVQLDAPRQLFLDESTAAGQRRVYRTTPAP